jgi:hypothetical protein
MTRRDLVRRLALNSISDDGENVDQIILDDVRESCVECGLHIERVEVVEALRDLVTSGLARAVILSQPPAESVDVDGMPPMDEVEEAFRTYFFITKKGMEVHLSDDPFDDVGHLRPGCCPDDAEG